jgi:hypothetical protein
MELCKGKCAVVMAVALVVPYVGTQTFWRSLQLQACASGSCADGRPGKGISKSSKVYLRNSLPSMFLF